MGNGTTLPINNIDDASLFLPSSSFQLHNLLIFPLLPKILFLFLNIFLTMTDSLKFHNYYFLVKHKQTGKLITSGSLSDDLYQFPSPSLSSPSVHLATKVSHHHWQRCVGHPTSLIVSRILHDHFLPFSPSDFKTFC